MTPDWLLWLWIAFCGGFIGGFQLCWFCLLQPLARDYKQLAERKD